ncbi:hypothetical protein [Azospirillum sp.]|uniref:hypothetical protein n=1 Tax=Azospirillum sp. TaxID=34012 RepID=UPI003D738E6E
MFFVLLLACSTQQPVCIPVRAERMQTYPTEASCMSRMDAVVSGWQMSNPTFTVELAGCMLVERPA